MAEKLPIVYTEADIPEQCLECPAFELKIQKAIFEADQIERWENANVVMAVQRKAAELDLPAAQDVIRLNDGSPVGQKRRERLVADWLGRLNALIDLHNDYAGRELTTLDTDEVRRQAVSDLVREMMLCTTGPINEYVMERRTTVRRPDEYDGYSPNTRQVRVGEVVIDGKVVQPGRVMTEETYLAPTKVTEPECGLVANPINSPLYGTSENRFEDADKNTQAAVFEQQDRLREFRLERDSVLEPGEYMDPKNDPLLARLRQQQYDKDPTLRAKTLTKLNAGRERLGLPEYVDEPSLDGAAKNAK